MIKKRKKYILFLREQKQILYELQDPYQCDRP